MAQQVVSSAIKVFYESKETPHGLPEDVLLHALEGYNTKDLNWPAIRTKALDFEKYALSHVSDCTLRRILRRPIGRKSAAASVSIFRLFYRIEAVQDWLIANERGQIQLERPRNATLRRHGSRP